MSVVGFGVSPGLAAGLGGADPTRFPPGQPKVTHPWAFHQRPDPGLPSGVLGQLRPSRRQLQEGSPGPRSWAVAHLC